MKIWGPDTCDCRIEEIYDGTNINGGGQVVRKCEAHGSVEDSELYGVLYSSPDGENKRKNQLERMLLGFPDDGIPGLNLSEAKRDADGSERVEFKSGVRFRWAFSGQGRSRVLQATIEGANLTPQQRTAILNACEARFGSGKVSLG